MVPILIELLCEGYVSTVLSKLLDFITTVIITCHSRHPALLFSILSTYIHVPFKALGGNGAFVPVTREDCVFLISDCQEPPNALDPSVFRVTRKGGSLL